MIKNLIKKNRTFRRFKQNINISEIDLKELIDLARLSASPRNQQALKFFYSNTNELNNKIFETLSWAGALIDWVGPEEGEKPAAYIIILGDNSLIPKGKKSYHEIACGIVAQSIMLGAAEKGFGGCMVAAIKRNILRKRINLPEPLEILLVLAIGVSNEKVIIEKMPENDNFNYWRDENQTHHVPKRDLENIIINKS